MALFGTFNGLVGTGFADVSASFSGSNYLEMSRANFGSINQQKFAVSAWFQRSSTSNNTFIMSMGDANASDQAFFINIGAGTSPIRFLGSSGSSSNGEIRSTTTFGSSSTWHHLLVHFDSANATSGDKLRLWINGVEEEDTYTAPTTGVTSYTGKVMVGAQNASGVGGDSWNGLLYQVAFFNGVLPDISTVYSSGKRDIRGLPGLRSLLPFTSTVTNDVVLSTAWTNVGTVTTSSTVPA